jgi:ribosomal protein S18 acetylase RimI-like enzyme
MELNIRMADQSDLADIQRIARLAYALYVPRIGREPAPMIADFAPSIDAGQLWVAATRGAVSRVMGFVVAFPRPDHRGGHWHLENVAVDPGAQGSGLGRMLIAHIETLARIAGARAVELYTNAAMTENQRLYPRLGYVETSRGTEDGFDRIFYRKALD